MNSLVLGFVYLAGMAWALCEVCLIAGTGNWLPLSLFLILFFVAFAIMGCLDVSDGFMNLFGSISAIILGFSLLFFAFPAFRIGPGVGFLKLMGALIFVVGGFITLLPKGGSGSHEHG